MEVGSCMFVFVGHVEIKYQLLFFVAVYFWQKKVENTTANGYSKRFELFVSPIL